MRSPTLLSLLFLSTTASAALLHRRIPQDPSFPARVRRSTQKAHIARSPSPQGPPSNPGEFIDPALSHANPLNNPPSPPSASDLAHVPAANFGYASATLGVPAPSTVSAAAASSATADMSDMTDSTTSNMDNSPTDAVLDVNASSDMGMNNSTSAYPSPSDQQRNWNSTLYYNTTDGEDYIDTVYPNGTETVAMLPLNSTGGPYGNGTQDGGPTPTGYAVLPGQTGSGPERLASGPGFKPGFTGPKGRRWLSGVW